jgi:uncharacterized protein YndB with AHSA1/START domain
VLDVRPGGGLVTRISDNGTDYRVIVRHGDPAARKRHAELGFADGWGSVTDQLAEVAVKQGSTVR